MLKHQKVSKIHYREMMFHNSVAVFVIYSTTLCTSLNCERKSEENCIEDCQWRKVDDKCIDCQDGYYGINCSRQCRYPNYGKHCQQDCSHCNREMCNSTVGCRTQNGTIDRESQNMIQGLNLPLVIGVFVGVAAVIVIAVLLVISFANRRFYSRQIRENAYYVGSVVSEHVTTTLCRVPEQRSDICDENIPTDNNTYMLASSLRYENI
ncbi:uncharacterized protein LOC128182969 isoform X2 [Crassostrea angulata]|uniref:uncharacterized protein LOC128182969 isoform X2 n=1 Tax=Magallana angulata TaxID=2784310 RepID=UPI0022B0C484|nr:uncharacterized protein LOC128182969 isoform X2 [Crassostrea angulata]